MPRLRIIPTLFLAALLASALGSARAEDASIAAQQRMILLWKAGDFPAAIAAGEALARDFPSEARGRTAHFHIGNYLENFAALECVSLEDLGATLQSAKGHYEIAAKIPGQAKAALVKSAEGAARMDASLRELAAIKRGELPYVEASARLADFEASRAASRYLMALLDSGAQPADHILFLLLVRQTSHADNMAARLRDAYEALREADPALFEFACRKYQPALAEAAEEAIGLAGGALARHPRSPYALDYRVYLGYGYQYAAAAKLAHRDWLLAKASDDQATNGANDPAAAQAAAEAAALLAQARKAHLDLLETVKARIALAAPTIAFAPKLPPSSVDLLRHRQAALDRLAALAAPSATFMAD